MMATIATTIDRGTLAARPATVPEGYLYYVTDTSTLYRSTGAGWESIEADVTAAAYTAEQARDDIGAALVAGSGIDITLDDAANTITIAAEPTAAGGGANHPAWITGFYYGVLESLAASTTGGSPLIANRLWLVPVAVPAARTIDRIAANVTTLVAASTVRLGIYSDFSAAGVATLLLDAGTIDSATTGAKTITISQALPAGWVWLACVSAAAVAVQSAVAIHGPNMTGQGTAALTGKEFAWFKTDAAAPAALPATFSVTGATNNGGGPLLTVRAA